MRFRNVAVTAFAALAIGACAAQQTGSTADTAAQERAAARAEEAARRAEAAAAKAETQAEKSEVIFHKGMQK